MPEYSYRTEHQRYLGEGIVFLSQFADIDPNDICLCRDEQKKIENRLKKGACKPWLQENRLKAEIQMSQWKKRDAKEKEWLGGCMFPRLSFKDADIHIMGSVALLEVLRTSDAPKLKKLFDLLQTEERWWVVDFFEHGMNTEETKTSAGFNPC
ncbi:hypothetical protein ACJQWK_02648 [Exserohilum turcicum]